MPRASSRSSLTRAAPPRGPGRSAGRRSPDRSRAATRRARACTARETRRCCAPSCRSRSMRRRSASAAAMMRCARVAQVVDALAQGARTSLFGGLARETDWLHRTFSLVPGSGRRLLAPVLTGGPTVSGEAARRCSRGQRGPQPAGVTRLSSSSCRDLTGGALPLTVTAGIVSAVGRQIDSPTASRSPTPSRPTPRSTAGTPAARCGRAGPGLSASTRRSRRRRGPRQRRRRLRRLFEHGP